MMNALWKQATSSSIVEDAARLILIKHALSAEFGRAVRELQFNFINHTGPITAGEEVDSLCSCLEAAFVHGFKYKIVKLFSNALIGNDRMPEPDFWPVVMVYSHKQVLEHIASLNNIITDVGRCRAWIRIALNDGLLKSYIESLIYDKQTLCQYYNTSAYLRDPELPSIMKQFLEGLDVFHFSLPVNYANLNTWSPEPLLLAGIWNPPESPEPVMPAEDAIKALNSEYGNSPRTKTKKVKRKTEPRPSTSTSETQTEPSTSLGTESLNQSIGTPEDRGSITSDSLLQSEISDGAEFKDNIDKILDEMVNDNDSIKSDFNAVNASQTSSPHSVPGFDHMFIGNDTNLPRTEDLYGGNKLMMQSGWSSSFDPEENVELTGSGSDSMFDSQSYESLFQAYSRNHPSIPVLASTPEFDCKYITKEPSATETSPAECISPDPLEGSDFEIIPKSCAFSSSRMDAKTQELFSVLYKMCSEKGLDTQQYKCHGCSSPVGMIYGNPLICTYDGNNYCSECHSGDDYYIPSRILYNWDFRKHPISDKAKEFVLHIQQEPLIDIRIQNPQLYTLVHELTEIQMLRTQLSFLRSYLFTCRQDISEQLRKMIWPREYLYEHIHLYSLFDLLQIPKNILAETLLKAVNFGKKHVLKCTLCSQKGFICEVCNSSKIIYPFETEITFHCEDCLAVYHNTCMNKANPCPKCQRRKKRKEENQDLWPMSN